MPHGPWAALAVGSSTGRGARAGPGGTVPDAGKHAGQTRPLADSCVHLHACACGNQEALTIRGRAAAGVAAGGGGGAHWSERTGKERLAEVMGRMHGDTGVLEGVLALFDGSF